MTPEDSRSMSDILNTKNHDKRNCKDLREIWNRYEPKEYSCFCDGDERIRFWEEVKEWYIANKTFPNDQ